MEVSRRYRIKVGRNAKGVWVPECSAEIVVTDKGEEISLTDSWRQQAHHESNAMVAELDERYPAPKE